MESGSSTGQGSDRRKSGILKKKTQDMDAESPKGSPQAHGSEHVKFDEESIAEQDQERGTRMKIDEPKTPYQIEQEALSQDGDKDVHMGNDDPEISKVEEEVKKHLEEAERNKLLNAQLQKEKQNIAVFHNELTQKLDNHQANQEDEEIKHQEFIKKRKDHYKNEFSPAMLLKQKMPLDEEEEEQDDKKKKKDKS